MNDFDGNIFYYGVILLICLIILGVCNCFNDSKWNNGYCSCGGNWVYQQAVGHRYNTYYLYECDNCGKVYEFRKKR